MAHVVWVSKSKHVDEFCLAFNKELCSSNQPGSVFIINHGGNWLGNGLLPLKDLLPLKELLLPRTCVSLNIASPIKGGILWTWTVSTFWTLDTRKYFRTHLGTLQVVSFLVFCQKTTPMHFVHLCTPSWGHCHKVAPSGRAHSHEYTVQVWSKSDWRFLRYWHFCILPHFSYSDHYQHLITSTWDMASDPMPQQLITQSAQATADAIASVLTARTASISLPVYDWNSQDAYHSSIFCCTLENWLLLNCILPDSEDHLRYVFSALGTKSLEMHVQWMPTGREEEQKATKAKASAFLDHIQQGITHEVNTHVCLGELEEIVARPGEDPKDLTACIKTLMDICEMINDEHCKHKLYRRIIRAYCQEGKLLGKLMAKPFKTTSSELAEIAVNYFAIQHAREQVSHSTKPVDTICQNQGQTAHTSHGSHGYTPSAPSKDCPNCTQLAEQTAQHMIPIVPNVTKWDTGDQNAVVASHSHQGMHPHLGHSRGSPDAHQGTTTTAKGKRTRQTP